MVRNPGSPNRRMQPSRREGSHRFIGSSLKTPLIAVSRKFSFGSWNQWAISKEILPRILRKYFPPFKKRAHEDCPHFKSRLSHPRMKLAAGRVRDAPLGTLVYVALLIVYDLILVITPCDINSMSTQRPEAFQWTPGKAPKGTIKSTGSRGLDRN